MVVFGAVIGGFLMEKGHIAVLMQPAELLILAGAAMGTLLVANPMHILKGIVAGLMGVLNGSQFDKQRYLSTLKMMYQFLNKVRKEGLLSVEKDVEKPKESAIFKNYPEFLADHHALALCVRHAAHGDHRRRGAVRHGPDDGTGYGGASPRGDAAGERADHGGGCAAGTGHCGGGAGRGDHDGRAGRTSGGDRREGGGGAGGHVSRHSAVLRRGGAAELEHEQDGR